MRAIAERMDPVPKIVSLDPHTIGEVLGDVRTLAQATDRKDAGVELVQDAAARIDRVRLATRDAARVRVAMLEWLDPIFVGGHWVPQLIEYAGGEDLLGLPGEPSEQRSWEEVAAAKPQVVIVAPCGYDVERGYEEALTYGDELAATRRREDRRRRRRRLVLAPRPAPGRGPRVARPRAAPRPGAGAARRRRATSCSAELDREDRARDRGGAHDHAGDDRRDRRPRRRLAISSTTNVATKPPINPPTWPPSEMPGSRTGS